ncbi:MAG: hypothetical protein GX587_03795 [Bacteroidales bacterium]|nr:hypothetical protein [Bacteroidales bacterium]
MIGLETCSEEAANKLIDASVLPDDWRDYPHHYGKDGAIRQHIIESRKCWLNGEKANCGYHLGLAFHYIADKWTLINGSNPNHSRWEQSISQCRLSDDDDIRQLVKFSGMSDFDKEQYNFLLKRIDLEPLGKDETLKLATCSRGSNWSKPNLDLNLAYQVSLNVGKSVFSPKTPPASVQKEIEASSKRMEKVLHDKMFQVALFFFMAVSMVAIFSLFAKNTPILILALLALLVSDIYTINLFFQKGSAFNNMRNMRSAVYTWMLLLAVIGIASCYAGIAFVASNLITSLMALMCIVSLFILGYLQFGHLNGIVKVHFLFTYLDWYHDPNGQSVIESLHIPRETHKQPNALGTDDLKRCWKCETLYHSDLNDKCPICGNKTIAK